MSELVSECKLQNSRISRGLDPSECRVDQVAVRLPEVCPVQRVERFPPELERPQPLADPEPLHHRKVRANDAWATEHVPAGVPVGTRLIRRECRGIEVPRDHIRLARMRLARIPDHVRT